MELLVVVKTDTEEIQDESWEIQIDCVREISLEQSNFSYEIPRYYNLSISSDHVLLWGYKDEVSQLNFAGPLCSHEKLLWDLYDRHYKVTEGWIPFERYINGHFIRNRLSGGGGLLADGPHILMREYASVLDGSDLETYFPHPPHPPVPVYGDRKREGLVGEAEDPDLSVLLLFDSYVVGTGFSARRL